MSTYYQYKDVADLIVSRLYRLSGWKVFGYHPTESDPYTDYYSPSYWHGLATKNGYVFVFNLNYAEEAKEEKRLKDGYKNDNINSEYYEVSEKVRKKIALLKNMTIENGCTPSEAESAKQKIEILLSKKGECEERKENMDRYDIVTIPAHQANPPRCNWHIEKNGIIVAKGSGMLKYSNCPDIMNEYEMQKWQDFNNLSESEWIEKQVRDELWKYPNTDRENAESRAKSNYQYAKKKYELLNKFNEFIAMLDSTCGSMMGDDTEFYTYEKVKVTEYKKENKAVESTGSIKDGQCFIVKSSFNYGINRGYVYRIHVRYNEFIKKNTYTAYKLNGKLTKECHGYANRSNSWYIGSEGDKSFEKFIGWIEKGSLAFCDIQEVKTPYEVEKVVKVYKNKENNKDNKEPEKPNKTQNNDNGTNNSNSSEKRNTSENKANNNEFNVTFSIKEDIDTRDNSKLWVVKINQMVSKEDYIKINRFMKSIGGYYSKYKHGFIFREDVSKKLNIVA